ncbi:Nif11-like leader peptide family natural product precursor [Pseudoflavitalea rhizosphaerae]|uniref:Nif11-like leader peptide family natural product precursor n=1 Tax=Pseudoflavitalea rhizosphaerae TaxID=1884793 RepID=UPI000F8CFA47|nr:Nif11-like leader peptide family natural product precursor [Pseudoflavitalea rhizosphaerae]
MSHSQFREFMTELEKDQGLKDRFTHLQTPEAIAEFAASLGFNFSVEEISAQAQAFGLDAMSDDDLDDIAGGQSMMGTNKPTQCWYSGD